MTSHAAKVIARLDQISTLSQQFGSKIGYLPALYRHITYQIKEAIDAGNIFQDNARADRFDGIFAKRFFDAYDQYLAGQSCSQCWAMYFDAIATKRLAIIQYLWLGVNAHIVLDLGIAAAEVAPGDQLPSLRTDFDTFNRILAGVVDVLDEELDELSPFVAFLDKIARKLNKAIATLTVEFAREEAWKFAAKLAPLTPAQQAPLIAERDRIATEIARKLINPGPVLGFMLWIMRMLELRNPPPMVIQVLLDRSAGLAAAHAAREAERAAAAGRQEG